AILINVGTVGLEAVTVSGIELNHAPVFRGDGAVIVITMIGIDPAIKPAPESAGESVRVLVKTEPAQQELLFIRSTIAVRVFQVIDVRNTECDHTVFVRVKADRNV